MSTASTPDFPLHGFSFETNRKRQKIAEQHPLWTQFEAYFRKHWNDQKPDMNTSDDRLLYEFFIEGAYRQSEAIAAAIAK